MKFWAPQPVGSGQSPHRLEIPKPLSWVYALGMPIQGQIFGLLGGK